MSEQQTTEPEGFGIKETERRQGFEPMPMAQPDDPPPEDLDSKDLLAERYKGVSAHEAADILMNGEAQEPEVAAQNEPARVRQYNRNNGAGERMPENQTVKLDRAARDIAGTHEVERIVEATQLDADLAAAVDALRAGDAQQPDQAQQPLPQPEQPVPAQEQPIEQQPARSTAWEDPEVIRGIQEYTSQVAGAFQQAEANFAAGLQANSQLALSALTNAYPELANVPVQQLGAVIAGIETQNPQRGAEIREQISNVSKVAAKAQEVQQQQAAAYQQQHRQQFDYVGQLADNAFDTWAHTQDAPERVREVSLHAREMLRNEGLNDAQINHLWHNDGLFRSATGQKLLYMASKYALSQSGAKSKAIRPVPTVQRPGSPASFASPEDWNTRQLSNKLSRSTGRDALRAAADLVVARRGRR